MLSENEILPMHKFWIRILVFELIEMFYLRLIGTNFKGDLKLISILVQMKGSVNR